MGRLERHPLARAVRIDKLSLAALAATLLHYLGGAAEEEIPVWRMIAASPDAIKERALRWRSHLQGNCEIEPSRSAVGGGSLPGETLPSWVLALSCQGVAGGGPEEVMDRLRHGHPPVVARVDEDRVLLDPRTVLPEEEDALLRSLRAALGQ